MHPNELLLTLGEESQAYVWAEAKVAEMKRLGTLTNKGREIVFEVREVADANVKRVEKELTKLTKLCRKYRQPNPVILFSPTRFVVTTRRPERDPETGDTYERVIRRICRAMVIVSPVYLGQEGWTLEAKVTHLNGEAIVSNFPGNDLPLADKYRHRYCQHCQTRRNRNETIVIKRVVGGMTERMVLGKDCLKEYTGIDPVHALAVAGWYEATGECNSTDRYEEPLDDFLGWVALVVRLDGRYWSKKAAEETNSAWSGYGSKPYQHPTVDRVGHLQFNAQQARQNGDRDLVEPTDEDRVMVEKVKAWALNLDPNLSTYHANVRALYRADALVWGLHGLAASAFAGYLREQEAVERARAQANKRPSEYLGKQGDKVDLPRVKVLAVREYDGNFGPTWIYKFQTPEGDIATWFSSNDCELDTGQEIRLRGSIKKLEEYRGEKQTVLTRCRVLPAA